MKIRLITIALCAGIISGSYLSSHSINDLQRHVPRLVDHLENGKSSLPHFIEYLTRTQRSLAVPQDFLKNFLSKLESITTTDTTSHQTHLFIGSHDTESLILLATGLTRLGVKDILFNVIDPENRITVGYINKAVRNSLGKNQRFSIQKFKSLAAYDELSLRLIRHASIIHIAASDLSKDYVANLLKKYRASHPLLFLTEGTTTHAIAFERG